MNLSFPCKPPLALPLLILLLALAGRAGALPALSALPGKAAAAEPTAPAPAQPPLRERLAQAEAELVQAVQPPPSQDPATPAERLEQRALLEQLVTVYGRALGSDARLGEAEKRRQEAQRQAASWRGFAEPGPPYSFELVEGLRAALQAAAWQQQADRSKAGLLDAEMETARRVLAGAQANARRADERLAAMPGGTADAVLRWQQALERLRSRVAAANAELVEAERRLLAAELGAHEASVGLLQRQLALAGKTPRFDRASLDRLLGELEQQRVAAEQHRQAQQQRRTAAEARLAEAERALRDGASGAQTLALRRAEVDNAGFALELAGWQLDALRRRMTAMRYRWELVNGAARSEHAKARTLIATELSRLDSWSGYLERQSQVVSLELAEHERRLLLAGGGQEAEPLQAMVALFRERAAMQLQARRLLDAQRGALQRWQEQQEQDREARNAREWLQDARLALAAGVRAVWDYELTTADDTVQVDGRKLTVKRSITIGKSVGVLVLLALGYAVSARLLARLQQLLQRRFKVSAHNASLLRRWGQFALLALLLVCGLLLVKIPLTAFAFLGGALALGAGLGAQTMLKNLMSGVTLLLERPLRVGDVVQVGEVIGEVCNIGIRSSTMRSFDGIETHVPNSRFLEQSVTNWTYSSNHVRFAVPVRVAYDAPLQQALALLVEQAHRQPQLMSHPEPRALLDDFGIDGMHLTLEYWLDMGQAVTQRVEPRVVASELRLRIAAALSAAGIAIPHPQRELHLRSAVPLPVTLHA